MLIEQTIVDVRELELLNKLVYVIRRHQSA
jgi:hypothetical protein